jgi:pilus assembly protein Flp/PilA
MKNPWYPTDRRKNPKSGGYQGAIVELAAYWSRFAAPYLRARFGTDERGASLVEYALLVALIAVVCIGAVSFIGGAASSNFSSVGNEISGP